MDIRIATLHGQKSQTCRSILRTLPEWFAIPEAVDDYVRDVVNFPMIVAQNKAGDTIGFISVKQQTSVAAEAYVLGVVPDYHRRGIGRLLFNAAEKMAVDMGLQFLTVKTLSADHPDIHYQATRLFYEAIGFMPLEVFPDLWSKENPCLMMIKPLSRKDRSIV